MKATDDASNKFDLNTLKNQGGNPFGVPDLSTTFPNIPNFSDVSLTDPANTDLVGLKTKVSAQTKVPNLDVNALEKMALQADTLGYNLSDQDFANRLPYLKAGRDYNIASAGANLAGGRDPFMTSSLQESGLGDIDFGTGEFNQARNMGEPILAKEARDRSYFSRLLADNPQRSFGLNAGDVAKIAEANTQGANMLGLGLAQGRVNQALANTASDAASNAALIQSIGSIAGAGIKSIGATQGVPNYASPTLNPQFYDQPGATAYSYQAPSGTYSGDYFNYGDPYSGNFYNASGDYVGNTFTGEGL